MLKLCLCMCLCGSKFCGGSRWKLMMITVSVVYFSRWNSLFGTVLRFSLYEGALFLRFLNTKIRKAPTKFTTHGFFKAFFSFQILSSPSTPLFRLQAFNTSKSINFSKLTFFMSFFIEQFTFVSREKFRFFFFFKLNRILSEFDLYDVCLCKLIPEEIVIAFI